MRLERKRKGSRFSIGLGLHEAAQSCRRRCSWPDQPTKRGNLLAQLFRGDEILRHEMSLEKVIGFRSRHAQRKARLVIFLRRSAQQMQDGPAHVWPDSALPA